MKIYPRFLIQIINSLLITFITGFSALSMADDTEIYLGTVTTTGTTSTPNILLVLDQSGSMNYTTTGVASGSTLYQPPTRIEDLKTALREIIDTTNNANLGIMTFANSTTNAPVRYPVSFVNGVLSPSEITQAPYPVLISGNDDAEQAILTGEVTLDGSTLHLGSKQPVTGTLTHPIENDAEERMPTPGSLDTGDSELNTKDGSTQQLIGLRFENVNGIPTGASITSATVRIRLKNDASGGNANFSVTAESDPDNSPFSTSNKIGSRTVFSSGILWSSATEPSETWQQIDVKPLVDEYLALSSWATSGKNMTFILNNYNNKTRDFSSQNDGSDKAPELNISYSTGAPKRQIVGLHYASVDIPQGTTITGAKLRLTAAAASNDSMNVTIKAEAADNSSPFTDTAGDLGATNRPTGTN